MAWIAVPRSSGLRKDWCMRTDEFAAGIQVPVRPKFSILFLAKS